MPGEGFVTQSEYQKHIRGEWRTVHNLWPHIRKYVPGYGYSGAEIDAMFEGYSGTGKAQIDAGNVGGLTEGSIPFADASGFLIEDNANLFWDNTLKVLEVLCPTTPAGYGNTYVGKGVIGAGNSVGTRNVILGYQSGYNNTSGCEGTFVGHYAGRSNTSASSGTLVGCKAGYYITESPSNTCLGYMSGITLTTGVGKNVCIGEFADAGSTGKENVSVGYGSLSALYDGFRNTCIGCEADVWDGDSQYRIAIGYNAISKEDNLCAIGGLLAADSVNLAIFYNREFRFYDDGNNYVGFKAPALGANQIWTLPDADGVAGGPIVTDGAGNLDFAVVTKQIYLNNAAFTKGATAPTQVILGNLNAWEFDIGDDAVMTVMLPPDWAAGTLITIKVCWYIDEAYAADKEIQWRVDWSALPHDFSETVDAPTHSGQIDSGDIDIPAVAKRMGLSTVGTIAGASLSAGDMLGFTLSRIAVTNDDPTADPAIHHLVIEYTADKLGKAT